MAEEQPRYGEPGGSHFPMTTALEIQGRSIDQNLGVVFGVVVRSMGMAKGISAGFKAMAESINNVSVAPQTPVRRILALATSRRAIGWLAAACT